VKLVRLIVKALLHTLMIFAVGAAFWTLAYYLTEWIYAQIGWQPHDLLKQLLGSICGFLLFGLFITSASPFVRKKQLAYWRQVINALKQMSTGDFHINLDMNLKTNRNDPMVDLVQNINDMAVNLKEMESMRQEFISNVSHEIQSPLTSIGGFAQAMIDEELDREDQLQYLHIIASESKRMSKLSDDLLRLASLNSEHHPFRPELFRLDQQLQLQMIVLEPLWLDKQIEIEMNLPHLSIYGDKDLLSQVWINLIHNAIKFTPEGGRIQVDLQQQDEAAVVRISDTGCGITEDDQRRIFERFFKADKSRTRATGGNGLGLSIVRKIVDMHQGAITVSSKPGEGTTFSVTIPIPQK
jgi:signal transduction histidine kinase